MTPALLLLDLNPTKPWTSLEFGETQRLSNYLRLLGI